MGLVNKAPYITPEMIDAWNNAASGGGGSGGVNITYLKGLSFSHSDFNYDSSNNRYRASKALTDGEVAAIFGSPALIVNTMGGSSASSKAQLGCAISVADSNKGEVMTSYSPYYKDTENYYAILGVNKASKNVYINISPTYYNMNWTFWCDLYALQSASGGGVREYTFDVSSQAVTTANGNVYTGVKVVDLPESVRNKKVFASFVSSQYSAWVTVVHNTGDADYTLNIAFMRPQSGTVSGKLHIIVYD